MNRLFVPTAGVASWRALLAEKHWRTGYSARALAHCWEEARGFPGSVRAALETSDEPDLREAELLLGIPEHEVALPGGGAASQTDLWVLARGRSDLISIAVEGKVGESFGPTVERWLVEASAGKRKRLAFLAECLALTQPIPGDVRYQLLHRTASAIIEARRFGAAHAVLLVHSFSGEQAWIEDYRCFVALFGSEGNAGETTRLGRARDIALHAAWVTGESKYLSA